MLLLVRWTRWLAAGVGAIISFGFFILNLINGQTVLGLFGFIIFYLFGFPPL